MATGASVKVLCGFFFMNLVSGFALPFEGLYKLDIIHYNDFHARFEETSVEMATCRNDNDSCLGGLARLIYVVKQLLREKPNALVLNAGDSFQGTYWYTLLKWNITKEFMNMIPHDAHAIGNHEFDDGPLGLSPYLSYLKAPIVAANMDVSKEPSLQGRYHPHIIVERQGRKIGIIGLITTDTKILADTGNVIFTDPSEAVRREAQILTDKGVDIIILLSHCGLNVDKELAREHGDLIDIIIGGHTHSLLWNGPSPSKEAVAGPYPVFIENAHNNNNNNQVLIVQASAFTKYMGNLSVYFDFRGDYVKWEGGPIFLNRSFPEDEDIKARLVPYAAMVHKAEKIQIAHSLVDLPSGDCVFGECGLGDMLVDAFNELAKTKVNSSYDYLAFNQRGNIKSAILKGPVTKGDIFELLPYDDRIETFELQGKYVLQALERGVRDAWAYNPFKGPWLLQVSGLRVTYNVSLPEGSRVTSVVTSNDTSKPLDSESYYQVTAPNYLAHGGDGFDMFKTYRRNLKVLGHDQNTVSWYIRAHSPLNITTDGRIKILH